MNGQARVLFCQCASSRFCAIESKGQAIDEWIRGEVLCRSAWCDGAEAVKFVSRGCADGLSMPVAGGGAVVFDAHGSWLTQAEADALFEAGPDGVEWLGSEPPALAPK